MKDQLSLRIMPAAEARFRVEGLVTFRALPQEWHLRDLEINPPPQTYDYPNSQIQGCANPDCGSRILLPRPFAQDRTSPNPTPDSKA